MMNPNISEEEDFEVSFKKQDNTWIASLVNTTKPENNLVGFGETPEEAFLDLFNEKSKDNYQKEVRNH